MKAVKQYLIQPVLRFLIRKNLVAEPKVVDIEERQCIGCEGENYLGDPLAVLHIPVE